MPNDYDILITLGHRYQVMRTNDNTPVGASYATRKEARDAMSKIEGEEYGYDWEPTDMIAAVEAEVSARAVKSIEGISGVTDKSTKKRTTTAKELP